MSMLAEQIAGMQVVVSRHLELPRYMVRPFWWMDEATRVAMNVRHALQWNWVPEIYKADLNALSILGGPERIGLITSPEGLEILKIKIAEQEGE